MKPALLVLASTYPRWVGDPEPGFVHELCRRLVGRFDVVVVCPHAAGAPEHETMDGVEVFRYRYAPERWERLVNDGGIVTNLRRAPWMYMLVPAFVLGQLWRAWRLLRRRNFSVIHAHWLIPQGVIAGLLMHFSGGRVPFVVTSHGADLYALRGRLLSAVKRWVVNRAGAVTVVSSVMRERLLGLGVSPRCIEILPMGVDLSARFTPDPDIKREPGKMLFVGRLVEKKGLDHLISALPMVFAHNPGARLDIAGFGPEEERLRQRVEHLGLGGRVDFLGAVPQSELPRLYRAAEVFVAPFVVADSGDQEGLPVAMMEAVACGCPIVAGNIPGLHDIFGDATHQFTVDPRDTQALAAKINAVLRDVAAALTLTARIRSEVVMKLDWERVAENYEQLLIDALGAPGNLPMGASK